MNPLLIPVLFEAAKYILTDQEAEGREMGRTAAAKIYAPVFNGLNKIERDIKEAKKKEKQSFSEVANEMSDLYDWYQKEIDSLTAEIEKLSKKSEKARNIEKRMKNCTSSTMSGVIASPDVYENTSIGLFGFMEGLMAEKRKKYYEIEYKICCRKWEDKIADCRKSIKESVAELLTLKDANKKDVDDIYKVMSDIVEEYYKKAAQRNTLAEVAWR